jgi:hypothetical protein
VCRAAGKSFNYDNMFVGQKYYGTCGAYRELEARREGEGFRSVDIAREATLSPLSRQLPHGRVGRPGKSNAVQIALSTGAPCEEGG